MIRSNVRPRSKSAMLPSSILARVGEMPARCNLHAGNRKHRRRDLDAVHVLAVRGERGERQGDPTRTTTEFENGMIGRCNKALIERNIVGQLGAAIVVPGCFDGYVCLHGPSFALKCQVLGRKCEEDPCGAGLLLEVHRLAAYTPWAVRTIVGVTRVDQCALFRPVTRPPARRGRHCSHKLRGRSSRSRWRRRSW